LAQRNGDGFTGRNGLPLGYKAHLDVLGLDDGLRERSCRAQEQRNRNDDPTKTNHPKHLETCIHVPFLATNAPKPPFAKS
jgi:hypothetical protein